MGSWTERLIPEAGRSSRPCCQPHCSDDFFNLRFGLQANVATLSDAPCAPVPSALAHGDRLKVDERV